MDDELKIGDILTDEEVDRVWDLYMGLDGPEAFRAQCMAEIVAPVVGRLKGGEDPAYAEKVFGALAHGCRQALKHVADGIRAEKAAAQGSEAL